MTTDQNWLVKVLKFITKDEVKTPLAFLYKFVPYLVASFIVVLYAPISDELKMTVFVWVLTAMLTVAAIVMLFAWFRPKNLVYGESGHRAEYQIEYGTESHIVTRDEINLLPNESDPQQPRLGQK